jgi:large subunit ribosomal protein L29
MTMKAKEIRAMAPEARKQELLDLQRESFNLRLQKATGQLSNSARIRKVRRDIARLRTVMNERGSDAK